jgi:hypothetical protein
MAVLANRGGVSDLVSFEPLHPARMRYRGTMQPPVENPARTTALDRLTDARSLSSCTCSVLRVPLLSAELLKLEPR